MTRESFDIAIIGGGIAGASVAAFLACEGAKAALFEMESSLAYHTTGRSAALLTPNYGPNSMRAFASIAVEFFLNPPLDTDDPLITPKRVVSVVAEQDLLEIERPPGSMWWNEEQVLEKVPFLRKGKYIGAVVDESVCSIDVHGLHSLYIKMFRKEGGKVFRSSPVTSLERSLSGWELTAGNNTYSNEVVINAAGAWGDQIASLAQIPPVGLLPKRRTVVVVNDEQFKNVDFDCLPFVVVEPDFLYFQNFGRGQLMMSPADQTPSQACDAQPDEIDIAVTIARFEQCTDLKVRRIDHSWAGLRTFSPDLDPVIGWEPNEDGFFWLTGQGGYGVFTSPGIGQYAAAIITNSSLSELFKLSPYNFDLLSPRRFRLNDSSTG